MLTTTDPVSVAASVMRRAVANPRISSSSGTFGAADVVSFDDRIELRFDIAGATIDDIDVSAARGILHVTATRTADDVSDGTRVLFERGAATMRRRFNLGDRYDTSTIAADYTNGVLTVTVAAAADTQPARVTITQGRGDAIAAVMAGADGSQSGDTDGSDS